MHVKKMKTSKTTAILLALFIVFGASTDGFAIDREKAMRPNSNIKNIIVLIPDGMSTAGVTLTRWYNAYNDTTGTFDTDKTMALDEMASGLVRNWWMNKGVVGAITDSAPAGTAIATGVKTNNKFIGVTDQSIPVATILEAAKLKGKSTGLVSTSQVMHATPAAFSSHYPDRSKEDIIAEQQVHNEIDVVFGAGSNRLTDRADKENLVSVLKNNGYTYITKGSELKGLTGKTWGMFAPSTNGAMRYEMDRTELQPQEPSLADMTKAAITILAQNKKGFFLMVEGSKVDWAAHANDPVGVISDVNAFDKAVKAALDFAKKDGKTMVLALTDHGNGGISIGDRNTTKGYDSAPLSQFIAPLKKARLTGEGVEAKFNADKTNIKQVMSDFYGITDLTAEEEAAIKATEKGNMNYTVGPMISRRANIGWTTGGHTGEEITLYTYLPGNERITGTIDNTDISKISAGVWGIDLNKTTEELYNNAKAAFEAKGATVKVDNSNPNNPRMIVTKGNTVLIIPENKNFVLLNGSTVTNNGVNVNIKDVFFIPSKVIGLIK